jgi:5-dehydro-4-deoxyglucarate dehydratase
MALAPEELRKKLTGVISFPVTPFHADSSLDLDGLRNNLAVLLRQPLSAIVAPSGTGELFSLSPGEHLAVVSATVEEARGRVPVLAAIGYNLPLGVELAQKAAAAGVDGLLIFPPYYPQADEEGLLDYYAALGRATALGVIVYSRDWVSPSPSWVERLAARVKTLVAWKDGQGDLRRYQNIIQRVGDRLQWIGGAGDDLVPAYYAVGCRCYTSSIANVAPRLSLELHELAAAGDRTRLDRLMRDYVVPLYEFRARRKGYEVSAMKEMMVMLGMAGGPVRPPLANVHPGELGELSELVERYRAFS